jgi:hypothetical protein
MSKEKFLHQVAAELQPESLYPDEAAAVLFGRVETARRVVKKAALRGVMMEFRVFSLFSPQNGNTNLGELAIPVHEISMLNRSRVFPPILPPTRITFANVGEIFDFVRNRPCSGIPATLLLDVLAGSGVTWPIAATLLEKLTGQRLDDADIGTVQEARLFWELFTEGIGRYNALVKTNQVQAWCGYVAYFDRQKLQALLPGHVLADHFQRLEFLTCYRMAEEATLDLYTVNGRPLCRHPFPYRFNPLIFGRPKSLTNELN